MHSLLCIEGMVCNHKALYQQLDGKSQPYLQFEASCRAQRNQYREAFLENWGVVWAQEEESCLTSDFQIFCGALRYPGEKENWELEDPNQETPLVLWYHLGNHPRFVCRGSCLCDGGLDAGLGDCRVWPGQNFAAVVTRTSCPGQLAHLANCLERKLMKLQTQVPPFAWSLRMIEFGFFGQSIQFSLIKYPDTLFRSDIVVAVGIQGRTR